jgi:lipoprotein-anchoring transpeptidase ErfK/SrfK
MVDMVYASSKTPLVDVNTNREFTSIPRHEVAEVYGKTDDCYLVYINGKLGYVSKEHVNSLGDTYIIIDISSQNLKLYVDDKLIIDTEIVTGKDSTPTYRGLFDVYKRGEDINWPEFGVTVRYGLAFNRGEWIHDAKWRKKFGGNIYHENGSHGCVNIPSEIMPTIYENADIGTPVLVKK